MKKSEASTKQVYSTRASFVWRWTKQILIGITGLLFTLIIVGLVFQFVATKIDESKYPAPGKMVGIGDLQLHLHCTGEGSPTVILDAGLGGGVIDWSLVQPEVAKLTRVCSYDRAGTGWSEPSLELRTSQQIANELHELIKNVGLQTPFVLVGHSIGGIHVQLFASQYPDEVSGMVLVDSSNENQFLRTDFPAPSRAYPLLVKTLAPFGVGRILLKVLQPSENIPSDIGSKRAAIYSHTGHLYSVADELANIPVSMEQLRTNSMRLGNKSLIVLTRGKKEQNADSVEDTEKAERAWQELQADLASRSSNGKQIIAEKSGHYIQFDQPELVVDAIEEVISVARQKK